MVHAGLRAASFRSTPREIHEVPSIQCRRPRLHRRLASRRRGRTERRRRLDRMVLQHRRDRASTRLGDPDIPIHAPDSLRWLPPLSTSARLSCIGLNYKDHIAETGRDVPAQPSVFIRKQAGVVGHGATMHEPSDSDHYDFESGLAVVIGKCARHVAEADALGFVAGCTCFNDGSMRDFQKHSVTAGKNFDRSGACGPSIATTDEMSGPHGPDPRHSPQRPGSAALGHRRADLFHPANHHLPVELLVARAGRRDCDRNAGRRWCTAPSAGVEEARRCHRSRSRRHRRAAQPGGLRRGNVKVAQPSGAGCPPGRKTPITDNAPRRACTRTCM
ncbi:hypothetical protein BH09PSE5_BH09PSE5_40980 [soil metagenome]